MDILELGNGDEVAGLFREDCAAEVHLFLGIRFDQRFLLRGRVELDVHYVEHWSLMLDLRGPNMAIASACATSAHAGTPCIESRPAGAKNRQIHPPPSPP